METPEEGFWIYKNGRRIFVKGKRTTQGTNKSNKKATKLYSMNVKNLKAKIAKIEHMQKVAERKEDTKRVSELEKLKEKYTSELLLNSGLSHISNRRKRIEIHELHKRVKRS